MLRFKNKLLLCLVVLNNLLFVQSGYGYGHVKHDNSRHYPVEQSDVGVPHYLPDIFKSGEFPIKFGSHQNVKTFGVKTGHRQSHSNLEDIFSSREASANLGAYKGGCSSRPETPANTMMKCSMYTGCRVTCLPDYHFDDGRDSHIVTCSDGKWAVQGWPSIPSCSPVCLPPCQHNGICVAPGQCNCPENFNGPQCQFEKKPCLNYPPLPKNSRRSCTTTSCTISCAKGHQFPDGSSITNVVCKEGNWIPTRQDMVTVPNCQPVCQPPCLNGGNCLSLNVCQCPQDFRGPQCQYSSDACSATKLGFNGGYNCSGDKEGLSCSISCPTGIHFSSPPVPVYFCSYASGFFHPQPIPQCVYNERQVIVMGGSSQAFYKSKNHSTSHENYAEKSKSIDHGHGGWHHSIKTGGTYGATNQFGYSNDSDITFENPDEYGHGEINYVTVEPVIPKPGICFTWGGAHFKTFDGKVYSFNSPCLHTLVRDARDSTFSVAIQNSNGRRRVIIFLQDKEYTLEADDEGGVTFKSSKRLLPIPAQLPGLRVQMSGHMLQMVLENLGVSIKWDTKQLVQVDVTESLWDRTEGLCGKIDGIPGNDMATKEGVIPKSIVTLADSWKVKTVGDEICEDTPSEQHACSHQPKSLAANAEKFCNNLVTKSRFSACSKIMDISLLLESCKWDYCGCPPHQSREECGCDSLAVYTGQCTAQGIKSLAKWRDEDTCMMNCTGGRVYQWCGPAVQLSCGSPNSPDADSASKLSKGATCTEGCFCPQGTLLHAGHCVTKDQCPCRLRGKQFPPGASVPKDCNTCTCQNGEWVCTQISCGARCSAVGDPHYQTFDGRRFDFMGQCSYYLVKGDNFSIEGENVACSGAISEAMNLASITNVYDLPACTKAVTIKYGETTVQLKQGRTVVVNGKDVTKLPTKVNGMKIRVVSSLFVLVVMPNGLEIWWDGMTRAHIDAPASFRGKTKGLCGTFNSNQKDDFLTPEGDVEQSVIPFANKWKTGEKCGDIPESEDSHPCAKNVQNKATAEKLCAKLKSHLFTDCHWSVDVTPYYEDCLYDMCACEGPVDRCLCTIIGAYATECARQGVQIQWRLNVKECEVHCPGGQVYQVCGDSCARSCLDLSTAWQDSQDLSEEARCRPRCVEGCNCPIGQALDAHGECVPAASCPCQHSNLEFPPQYKEVRPGSKEQELCVCVGASWSCRPATPEEIVAFPRAADIKDKCSAAKNEEFTTCEPIEPLSCKNMHQPPQGSSAAECHPGCQCKKGFVRDNIAKRCIKAEDCPCHHGGRSYPDGETMQEDCNTCKCNGGKWSCEKRPCSGVCSTWGDSHFHTFDGKVYDFQGVCTYLLVKGGYDTQLGFSIDIQNEVCGTSGVTCSKAITLKVGLAPDDEIITFTKDKSLPDSKHLKRIKLRHAGLFVFAEVPSLGIVLQWDKGTRVYVKADPQWKGRLKGLCGNYNENQEDDFQTPSGGVSETSARLFGDSWKLQPFCPPASEVQDTCALHPERQSWSVQRCGALKRHPFSACHSEVPVADYLNRCERDTCACGLGGDCECLCTALAAYAHQCASRGVPLKWRTQEMCPMQCDETCTNYSPCITTCPVETCVNTLFYSQITEMCPQDTCVEGCKSKKSCPEGQVISNVTSEECVPRSSCKPVCITLPNGKEVLEGEVMEEDQCHSCHCSRGAKVCKGQPCSTLPPGTTKAVPDTSMKEEQIKCKSGWTEWISNSVPEHSKSIKTTKPYSVEIEELPTLQKLKTLSGAICPPDMMVDVECRTVVGHASAKETGVAECSLEGLRCRQPSTDPCPDFEIRVKCKCEEDQETTPEYVDLWTTPKVSSPEALSHLVCDTSRPNQEYPGDCARFLQCAPGMGPSEHPNLVEKTCGPHMFYNPKSMTCDWPQTVIAMKPECGVAKAVHTTIGSTISFKEEIGTTEAPCEDGKVWSECAVNCRKVCKFYDHYLKTEGKCSGGQKCVPGCVDESVAYMPCGKGFFWRDAKTCVALADCTCVSSDGKPVKPGEVVHEETCKVCQCLNNEYTCDESSCVETEEPSTRKKVFKPEKLREKTTEKTIEMTTKKSSRSKKILKPEKTTKKTMETTTKKSSASELGESVEEEEGHSFNVPVVLLPTTLSPPPECHPDRYMDIMWGDAPMPDEAFSASSSMGPSFMPQNAKLNGKISESSGGSWTPKESTPHEYIQVKLDHKEPVYGIVMQGSPLFDQFVTSYEVMYSDNGHHFNHVNGLNSKPQVFRGPVDNTTPLKQMFDTPFEAQYVRVHPLTWHDTISVRMELIGCSDISTVAAQTTTAPEYIQKTTLAVTTIKQVKEPVCEEPQKLIALPVKDILVSSSKSDNPKKYLSLEQPSAWQPFVNSPKEWVQFDFGEVQNITGIITKGGPNGWVSAYNVKYSPDGNNWNPVVDSDREIRMFPANYDKDTPVTNSFDVPIHARYLKIMPAKWDHDINMRIEPQGCHEPYTLEHEEIPEFTMGPEVEIGELTCPTCPGLEAPPQGCDCAYPLKFDGVQCGPEAKCPCIVGHIPYVVGATYLTENCETCTCTLGGVPACEKKSCPKCKNGLVRSLSKSCECSCVPCPSGKLACPTSEVCIPQESWCDGVEDCPDDELDCATTELPTTTAVAEVKEVTCPVPTCPKGYKVVEKKPSFKNLELMNDGQVTSDSLFAQPSKSGRKGYMRYFKGGTKGGSSGGTKGGIKTTGYRPVKIPLPRQTLESPVKAEPPATKECAQWRCLSARPPPPLIKGGVKPTLPPCPAPRCPPDYTISMDNEELDEYDCPKYACTPPARRDAVCNVTCRIFNTFDGTEFQYDICNHVLARDADMNTWDVTIQKNCTKELCVNELLISQGQDQVRFRPDLTVEYNGYLYTVDQTRKIGFQTQTFAISRLGDTLFYISTKYGFWVTYDNKKNIRIGVAGKLYGRVDGLCGFFNGEPLDDRRKPDGSPARSTEEFGDSWAHKDSPEVCEVRACPINLQNEAWEMCKAISSKIFSGCSSSIDIEKSRARCLEAVCECMQNSENSARGTKRPAGPTNSKSKICLCEALQTFVTGCQAADQTVNLQGWRTEMSCPAICPAPLVHYDCFRRRCELSCSTLQEEDPCPTTPGVCFSGCFCPEGMVRKGESCIPPTECRDCVCDGLGKPKFVTFDRRNFTFNGNCTYIAARDKSKSEGKHAFQVYVTNGKCPDDPDAICAVALHIIYGNHTLHIQKYDDELRSMVDGMRVRHYPHVNKWLQLQEISGRDISLLIPSIQLEVSSIFHNMAFTIRVPSMLYGNKTEGLCGNCDGDPDNDLGQSDEEVRKFGLGWRAPPADLLTLDIQEENCVEKPKDECWPLPPDEDPCFKIMDDLKFGKCHPVVDPTPFVASCQQDLCSTQKQQGLCASLEAYARQCERAGICLDWRREDFCPYKCENHMIYKACSLGCQITCENYEKYSAKPTSCTLPLTEGCVCPEGQVAVNGKCIPHTKCFPCDTEGHYVGDSWHVNECTMCTCKKKGGVMCMERACDQATVCAPGLVPQQIAKTPGNCCPEFICAPEPSVASQCDEPIKIECGFGQVLKLETVASKCPMFVCHCKPLDECDPIEPNNEVELLEPGMEKVIVNSGCCPQAQLVCKPDKCPEAPKCPPHHKPKANHKDKECCPTYTCEPPSDKCLYDMEYESSPSGGETKRPAGQVETIPKALGATWQDGPCRLCVCKKLGGSQATKTKTKTTGATKDIFRAVCSVTQCPAVPESEDFVTESVGVPFACCPKPKYSACKDKGTVYKINEEWKSDTNPCVIYMCAEKEDGTLEKRMIVKQCDKKCKQGWKYAPSPNPDKICCGECIAEACIVNGVERKIGEKWTSDDYCTNFVCLNKNGTLQVQSMGVSCPAISKNMREDFELEETPVEGKCCKTVKPVACKVEDKIYKVGDEWQSDTDPCVSHSCVSKEDGNLEKQISVKQCEEKCKPGWKYSPSPKPDKICCGECVPVACVVAGVERKIGEEWTSEDYCTKYICLNKKGILQVQSVGVSCPAVSENMREEFELEETPVDGKCCKNIKPIACKVEGKVFKIGEEWPSNTDPCVSYMCASKGEDTLEKQMKITQCDKKCKQGWKYSPSPKPDVKCCGECIPVACVVAGVERKIGEEWTSKDYCTKFMCLNKNGTLQVQSMEVSCPTISKNMREEFELEETQVEGTCCKAVKPVACKVDDKIYKIGEEWKSTTNPCVSYMCVSKNDGSLEKQMKVKQCDKRCKQGWKYNPSSKPDTVCCGECVPVACVVAGVERKIGEEWTSKDHCTNFLCLNKNGTLQVQSMGVSCPTVSENTREEFELEETPVEGKCCKAVKPVACKVEGKIYKIGDEWKSKTNPCVSYLCTSKDDAILEKQMKVKQCDKKCKQGWEYKPSPKPDSVCCGECIPVACVVAGVERKIGEEWTSEDYCTKYVCLNKNGVLQVQSVGVSCPTIGKNMREEFELVETPVEGKCCKTVKPVACKVDGKTYKVGEKWISDIDPCVSFTCAPKEDGSLEKQKTIKQCEKKCKQGWEYVPSSTPTKVCCGECLHVACVVHGEEKKIGEEWTSADHCTNFFCLNKTGTLQVEAISVSCPVIPTLMAEEFVVEEIAEEGKCCKKIVPVACKVNGEIYREGSSWRSPDGDPCKNVTCTRDQNNALVRTESAETCHTECSPGWEYRAAQDPHTCCGQCVQTACVVEEVLYKADQVWYSPDNCTQFSCNKQGDQLVVSSQQDSCPNIAGCNPKDVYLKGCCKHCNITSLPQKSCLTENLPAKDTIGMIHQMNHIHGLCVNKKPILGFKECKGACNSGTSYNDEKSIQESDCKCCQIAKYEGLIIEMTCEDGYLLKRQVAIPSVCECLACIGEAATKSTKSGRKIAGVKSGRSSFSSDSHSDLDDVEIL